MALPQNSLTWCSAKIKASISRSLFTSFYSGLAERTVYYLRLCVCSSLVGIAFAYVIVTLLDLFLFQLFINLDITVN